MRIFFPVCATNVDQAVKVLAWAAHLKTDVKGSFVVLYHNGAVDPSPVIDQAKDICNDVTKMSYGLPDDQGYPWGKNAPWQAAAWWMNDHEPQNLWFYWEPDAVPIRKGWLDAITKAAQPGRVTGCVLPSGIVDGVAVYPGDVMGSCPEIMLCRAAPFDQYGSMRGWLDRTDHSNLFQVRWTVDGMVPTFETKAQMAAVVDKEAVIFHRNKDCTLIDRLLTKRSSIKGIFNPKKKRTSSSTCIVMLGRYGDVINALPVARGIAQEQNSVVPFMVHEKYADVLEGCSYVKPVIWKGEWIDLNGAIELARKQFGRVLVAQVNGRNFGVEAKCDSFAAESWRQMGYLGKWNTWPLVFDKRIPDREADLCAKHLRRDRRNILLNLKGISSPADWSADVERAIRGKWGRQANIVNLQDVKAHRIYDLLGLYDKADLLITLDTATLHLAYASGIKSIQFIVDSPTIWHGARPRGNAVLSMRYFDVPHRMEEVHDSIRRVLTSRRQANLIHCFSHYDPPKKDEKRRYKVAADIRETIYNDGGWIPMPVQDCVLPRMFEDGNRKLPYVKDLIDYAMAGASPDDVVVFTNIDICLVAGINRRLWDAMNEANACYCFRRDFHRLDGPVSQEAVDRAKLYPGSDLYAFRVSWWRQHAEKMPDMLLGAEAWDWCLRLLIEETNVGRPVGYKNWIYHERHDSMWERSENRLTLPSQKYNIQLAIPFLEKRGVKIPQHFGLALNG